MQQIIVAIYPLSDLNTLCTSKLADYATINEIIAQIVNDTGITIPYDSTYFTTHKTKFDKLTGMAFNVYADGVICEFEIGYGVLDAPTIESVSEDGYLISFAKRLAYFVEYSSKYIERIEYYDTYKSQLMTGSTKNETHSGIDNSTRNAYDSRTSKLNNTPQEEGDYTGDGYVNEVTITNGNTSVGGYTTYGHVIDYTNNEDIAKRLRNADKSIKNIYTEWLEAFRNICLLD